MTKDDINKIKELAKILFSEDLRIRMVAQVRMFTLSAEGKGHTAYTGRA